MKSGVYIIAQLGRGRVYVGSSIHVGRRIAEHRQLLRLGKHHCKFLQHAWNKHGEPAFDFLLWEETEPSKDALLAAEQAWIDCFPPEALLNDARKAYSRLGSKSSRKTKAKIRRASLRISQTSEGRAHLLRMTELAYSNEEARAAMDGALRREAKSKEGRKRRSELCSAMWADGRMKATPEEMQRRSLMRKLFNQAETMAND